MIILQKLKFCICKSSASLFSLRWWLVVDHLKPLYHFHHFFSIATSKALQHHPLSFPPFKMCTMKLVHYIFDRAWFNNNSQGTAAVFINRKNGLLINWQPLDESNKTKNGRKFKSIILHKFRHPCTASINKHAGQDLNLKSVGTISPMNIQSVFLVIISVRFIIDDLIENLYLCCLHGHF